MARNGPNTIYSATYSNVPVYEFNCEGNHVMRRRADDWINATHILKVAEYDKPARTRILEREVQQGVHEKVQGGYGKYQGTWIPLGDGKGLAERNGVLAKLLPIFDFVPGDRTPPPAPKHATAASKPRGPKAPVQPRRPARKRKDVEDEKEVYSQSQAAYAPPPEYEQIDVHMPDIPAQTPDNATVASESAFGDYDVPVPQSSRKRRRVDDVQTQADIQHQLWADDLLDYFVLVGNSDDPPPSPPVPPAGADLDRPIDEKGHTALHWAAAMGDVEVVKDLLRRNASLDVQSHNGETPLMRAVQFTNCWDKQVMGRLAGYLIGTVRLQDWTGSTVFHYIANSTQRRSKYQSARYYMDCILNRMSEAIEPGVIDRIINEQDQNGDTAITIAARYGARKCVRSLIGRNAAVDIPNRVGDTADHLIVALNRRRQERNRQLSSSPFQAAADGLGLPSVNGMVLDPLLPHGSLNGTTDTVYRSEAAVSLTSNIMPTLFSKAKQLASTLDAEITEKDAELSEAKRVLETRAVELEALRRQQEHIRTKETEQTSNGTETDEQLEEQLQALEQECAELVELEQLDALASLGAAEEATYPSTPEMTSEDLAGNQDAVVDSKISLARQLVEAKSQRFALVHDIVRNLGSAGLEEGKSIQYARLIKGAMGVSDEDLRDLLPEIVDELEMGRGMEVVGA